MGTIKRFNILEGFSWKLLDDPEFQEDSVREEIIVPILRGLGYSADDPYKIVRSKKLIHPFVSIGSATKKIYLVPDYLLQVEGKNAWILEAKGPNENILNSKHTEQAYSYAMHSEIRVQFFALCNGREFVLHHVSRPEPILHFDMRLIPSYWDNLLTRLSPEKVLVPDLKLKKDLGLHLKRLGFSEFSNLIFSAVPIPFIARLAADQYNFSLGLKIDGETEYMASFDFSREVMSQLAGRIPEGAMKILAAPFSDRIDQVMFGDMFYQINIDCRVGEQMIENDDEIFLPLTVNKFF